MLKAESNAIRQNFVLLVRELPFREVVSYLYQDGLLSEFMVLDLLNESPSNQNFELLFLLFRRGPRAYTSFLKALEKAKRQDLVWAITRFEDKFADLTI